MKVTETGLIDYLSQLAAILKSLFNLGRQVFRNIKRDSLLSPAAIQNVVAVAFATRACCAVFANTRGLAQRKRSFRNRPHLLYGSLEPELDAVRALILRHMYMRTITHIRTIHKLFLQGIYVHRGSVRTQKGREQSNDFGANSGVSRSWPLHALGEPISRKSVR